MFLSLVLGLFSVVSQGTRVSLWGTFTFMHTTSLSLLVLFVLLSFDFGLFSPRKKYNSEHVFSKFVQHRWVLRITVAMGCRELLPPYAIHLQQYKSPT